MQGLNTKPATGLSNVPLTQLKPLDEAESRPATCRSTLQLSSTPSAGKGIETPLLYRSGVGAPAGAPHPLHPLPSLTEHLLGSRPMASRLAP
jgi:hypothetical protein